MHTNYTELAIRTGGFGVGYLLCGLMHSINWCLCGMHCHQVPSVQPALLPRVWQSHALSCCRAPAGCQLSITASQLK